MGQAVTSPTPAVIAVTFARGGSKGVPRKNVRPLAGKPLIAHAIEAGRASRCVGRHIVSTDDEEIAEIARSYGAEVPFMRPAELASDTAPEILSWKHAIRTLRAAGEQFDVMVSLPATAPLRRPQDIDSAVALLVDTGADLVITVSPSQRSPYFNMVTLDPAGRATIVMGNHDVFRRQDAPRVFDVATVAYAARPDYMLDAQSAFEGDVRAVEVPASSAVDIDTELDFQFAEFLAARNKEIP